MAQLETKWEVVKCPECGANFFNQHQTCVRCGNAFKPSAQIQESSFPTNFSNPAFFASGEVRYYAPQIVEVAQPLKNQSSVTAPTNVTVIPAHKFQISPVAIIISSLALLVGGGVLALVLLVSKPIQRNPTPPASAINPVVAATRVVPTVNIITAPTSSPIVTIPENSATLTTVPATATTVVPLTTAIATNTPTTTAPSTTTTAASATTSAPTPTAKPARDSSTPSKTTLPTTTIIQTISSPTQPSPSNLCTTNSEKQDIPQVVDKNLQGFEVVPCISPKEGLLGKENSKFSAGVSVKEFLASIYLSSSEENMPKLIFSFSFGSAQSSYRLDLQIEPDGKGQAQLILNKRDPKNNKPDSELLGSLPEIKGFITTKNIANAIYLLVKSSSISLYINDALYDLTLPKDKFLPPTAGDVEFNVDFLNSKDKNLSYKDFRIWKLDNSSKTDKNK